LKSAGTKPSSRASEVRAALCNEIAAALQAVWEHRRPGDATVHEVRKDLKRARAALRLLREAVGDVHSHFRVHKISAGGCGQQARPGINACFLP